ncbi:hypothetical protein L950_0215605 [Sphingobacterium sp. IITKGP-BTPF85]|nr:hypothetical protein L950_0215605 [Sphingobacterium sp. IITKGP-BTPF85]
MFYLKIFEINIVFTVIFALIWILINKTIKND